MSYQKLTLAHQLGGHSGAIYGLSHVSGSTHFYTCGGDGWIVQWDIQNPDPGRLVARVESQAFTLQALNRTGEFVVGNMHGGVHWVDQGSETAFTNIAHHRNGVFAFVRHGGSLFSAGGEGLLTKWSLAEKRPIESWQLSVQAIRCLDIHPSVGIMACGASDGRIYYLSIDQMKVVHITETAHVPSVFSLKFSRDGRFLWSGGRDAQLRCWSVEEDFRQVYETPAHLFTVNALAFDPTGAFIATGSRDKTIRIWDRHTGELLQALDTVRDQGHRNSVNNLLWLGGARPALISVSDDRTVRIWEPQ